MWGCAEPGGVRGWVSRWYRGLRAVVGLLQRVWGVTGGTVGEPGRESPVAPGRTGGTGGESRRIFCIVHGTGASRRYREGERDRGVPATVKGTGASRRQRRESGRVSP